MIKINKNFKNLSAYLLGLTMLSSPYNAFASEDKVVLVGATEFTAFNVSSNGTKEQKLASSYKKGFGLYTSGSLHLKYTKLIEDNYTIGANIGLELTTKNSRVAPSSIYYETNLGKIELGSDKSAMSKMRITGMSVATNGMTSWDIFTKVSADKAKFPFITSHANYIDAKCRNVGKIEYSRKISLYTPEIDLNKLGNIQLGLSIVPDSTNVGTGDILNGELHSPLGGTKTKFALRDGLAYGAVHNINLADNIALSTAITGERAKATGFETDEDNNSFKDSKNYRNLDVWSIGAKLKINKFELAAAYVDNNKSLFLKSDSIKKSKIHSFGIKYNHTKKLAFSVTHFHSRFKNNVLDSNAIGLESKISDGFNIFTQLTQFESVGKILDEKSQIIKNKTKGNLVSAGVKLVF